MVQAIAELEYKIAPDNRDLSHIPGDDGWPYFGRTFAVFKTLRELCTEHLHQYGPVSRISLLGQTGLLVMGPDNYQRIYLDKERNFSAEMGYAQSLGNFYKGGLLLRDFDEHRFQRRIMQSAFKTQSMKDYAAVMNPMLAQSIAGWNNESNFVFFPQIKQLLLEVGARIFIGIDDMGTEGKVINDAFLDINDGLVSLVRKELPFTNFARGQKSKRFLEKWFADMIPKRRAGNGKDMLTHMAHEKTDSGEYFPEIDIIQHAMFLLFAAHDTTTSVLSHLAMYLGKDQALQNRMRAESLAIGKAALDYDDLEKMTGLDNCFHETLRLHPSVPIMTRRTIRDAEIGGYRVPANTILFMPTVMNHVDPDYWSYPNKFDPDRFSDHRAEHKHHSFCYHPFGGGAHKCIGLHFASMLTKCFMHQFLLSYRFKTAPNYQFEQMWVPLPKPLDGVPLTLEPIKVAQPA